MLTVMSERLRDGIAQAEKRHAELKQLGLEGKIVLIGKKGITYFNRRTNKYDIVGECDASALTMSNAACDCFSSLGVHALHIASGSTSIQHSCDHTRHATWRLFKLALHVLSMQTHVSRIAICCLWLTADSAPCMHVDCTQVLQKRQRGLLPQPMLTKGVVTAHAHAGRFELGQAPTTKEAQAIADSLYSEFVGLDVDKVELVYTKFVSLISSDPIIQTLLPLTPQVTPLLQPPLHYVPHYILIQCYTAEFAPGLQTQQIGMHDHGTGLSAPQQTLIMPVLEASSCL